MGRPDIVPVVSAAVVGLPVDEFVTEDGLERSLSVLRFIGSSDFSVSNVSRVLGSSSRESLGVESFVAPHRSLALRAWNSFEVGIYVLERVSLPLLLSLLFPSIEG